MKYYELNYSEKKYIYISRVISNLCFSWILLNKKKEKKNLRLYFEFVYLA